MDRPPGAARRARLGRCQLAPASVVSFESPGAPICSQRVAVTKLI